MPVILIRKVKEDFGWLGNMSPHPIAHAGQRYPTAEALFQSLRFREPEIVEEIRGKKSPMAAKFAAKKHKLQMVVTPLSIDDLKNMRLVVGLKLAQHPALRKALRATGEQEIVEDCTNRPRGSGLFWGAAQRGEVWNGKNWLGKIWMNARSRLNENGPSTLAHPEKKPEPFPARMTSSG